jgi:NAD(P)-dependent dehydrogenase (short-subunit alcohol dehydrogenase family)
VIDRQGRCDSRKACTDVVMVSGHHAVTISHTYHESASPAYRARTRRGEANGAGSADEAELLARVPARRTAEVSQIASVIAFLGSSAASFVTGQTIAVDGGFLADCGIGLRQR